MDRDNPFVEMDISGNEEEAEEEDDAEIDYNYSPRRIEENVEKNPVEFHNDAVTALNQCQSHEARKLCIFNLDYKLPHSDHYDIGGTYTKSKPDLWFYCTTSVSPDNAYIFNLFVCHRRTGAFKISISDTTSLNKVKNVEPFSYYLLMPNNMITRTFKSMQIDQSHHIKSFYFTKEDVANLESKTLCIPIEIDTKPKCPVDKEVLMGIKRRHGLSGLFKRGEDTDFVLETMSGKKYDTHKIILATHSPVIKEIIRTSKSNSVAIDINDEEMELLLEFMYTGTVKSIIDENCYQLLDIGFKFKLESLLVLTQFVITQKITIKNAVDIAVLTEKYKLDNIQKNVFEFIKKNPQVLDTEGWQNLNDVALTKKLFKEIYVGSSELNK